MRFEKQIQNSAKNCKQVKETAFFIVFDNKDGGFESFFSEWDENCVSEVKTDVIMGKQHR